MAPCSFSITVIDTTVADCKLLEVSAVSMTLLTCTEPALGRLTETESFLIDDLLMLKTYQMFKFLSLSSPLAFSGMCLL